MFECKRRNGLIVINLNDYFIKTIHGYLTIGTFLTIDCNIQCLVANEMLA